MKKENVIREKSFKFAVRTINLYKVLSNERKEFINEPEFNSLHSDASELLKIIRSIILSSKK